MTTGKYDRLGTVQRPVVIGKDETYNTDIVEWQSIGKRWMQIMDDLPSKDENLALGQPILRQRTRVRLRYCTDLDSTMRILLSSRVLQIVGGPVEVVEAGRRKETEVYCEDIQP